MAKSLKRRIASILRSISKITSSLHPDMQYVRIPILDPASVKAVDDWNDAVAKFIKGEGPHPGEAPKLVMKGTAIATINSEVVS